jgi:hypothetical protein
MVGSIDELVFVLYFDDAHNGDELDINLRTHRHRCRCTDEMDAIVDIVDVCGALPATAQYRNLRSARKAVCVFRAQ